MNKKELISALKNYPNDTEIVIKIRRMNPDGFGHKDAIISGEKIEIEKEKSRFCLFLDFVPKYYD